MSSRRLLLEGSDLPALLRRAEELGGRVVRAERLRRGLFARRWYEVTVDVPEDDVAPVINLPRRQQAAAGPPRGSGTGGARAVPKPGPAGIDDLVAAAEAAEAAERTAAARRRAARAASSRRRGDR